MSSAVFAQGHWRRRDMLEGLAPSLLAAIEALSDGALALEGGRYTDLNDYFSIAPSTLSALAYRGLAAMRFPKTPQGETVKVYMLTPAGRAVAAEIARRRANRVKFSRSR